MASQPGACEGGRGGGGGEVLISSGGFRRRSRRRGARRGRQQVKVKKKKNKLSQSLSLLLSPARSRPRQTAKECNVTAWSHTSSIAYLAEDAFTCTSGAGPRAELTVRGVVLSRRAGSAVRKLEMGLGGG